MKRIVVLLACALACGAQNRIILAVGAHCGDAEIAAGAVLAKHRKLGDRIVILHLTLGERGHPRLNPEEYGRQKRAEALAAAEALGAEPIFGPYRDGELPNDETARKYVAGVIRKVRPTHILTHWKNSIHKDHAAAYAIVTDATLLAALEGVELEGRPHRGLRGVWFMENWEDPEDFKPYLYVEVSGYLETWKTAVTKYEFIRGGVSRFPYLDYYEALARIRGAESGAQHAVAFDVAPESKKRIVQTLP